MLALSTKNEELFQLEQKGEEKITVNFKEVRIMSLQTIMAPDHQYEVISTQPLDSSYLSLSNHLSL